MQPGLRLTRASALVLAASAIGLPSRANDRLPPGFEQDIAPVLSSRCGRCHGIDETEAGLDLTSATGLRAGSESGPVLQPGDPDASLLYLRVHAREMPPEGEPALTDDEIDLLRRWIEGGAETGNAAAEHPVDQHRIIPLMLLRCAACHGAARQEGHLDLRTPESMLSGGDSGPAVVPGDPDASLLVRRIRAEEMPPRRRLVEASVKPMTSGELQLLETWIRDGMPISETPPAASQPAVTDEDRAFWSFRSPIKSAIPDVAHADCVHNPIDAFLLQKLEAAGLAFSPAADRAALLRRVTFDLTGLPPSPDETLAFLADDDPLAYERLVDRLLASPQYGVRWGRRWLDVAGYADSEGAQNEDRVRTHHWRYRDYVIRSFNDDKPYNRFLTEQIAGDELADYEHAPVIDDAIYDNLVATGFLRTAPDRTFAEITNFVPDRLEVIADEMQILGSAVLGLTIHCARCHNHKFDPISQRDYYGLLAVFKDAYDEHDWLPAQEPRTLPCVTTAERTAWEQYEAGITSQIDELKSRRDAESDETARTALDQQIAALEATRLPEPRIAALWSRGRPSPTYILMRGNYLTPGASVEPSVPAVLSRDDEPFAVEAPWPGAVQTGRRLALARWLTRPDHPLTARVMVNRIWRHHFGTGLVATLENFGKTGERPSHPELLDWLAVEFVESGWSVKHIHRLILTSAAYRQSSLASPASLAADPDGRLLSRMPLVRMEAEVLRDSMLVVSGTLDDRMFGTPDAVERRDDGLVTPAGGRRSIFVLQRRTQIPTLLDNFDFPQMGPNCTSRREAVVPTQALHLLNDATIHELAGRFAARVRNEAGDDPDDQIERIYLIALSRAPAPDEKDTASTMLADLTAAWEQAIAANKVPADTPAADRALASYCHAMLNSAAFLYID